MVRDLHRPAGALADGADPLLITPRLAGWRYAGLRVIRLAAGESRHIDTGSTEMVVLPLSGSCTVECEGARFELRGRRSVFDRVTDFSYAPVGAEIVISSTEGGEFALPMAEATRRFEPAYVPAERVSTEVRGAGPATRQITNLFTPEAFEAAQRLIVVEVLTPGGNWSSYPPHKHDTASESEAMLEEIYYFKIAGERGFGFHRTYSPGGPSEDAFDITVTVRDGDAFLIPRGYHGPSVAAPGYPMYYLNVLAGPAEPRTMRFCDDPAHHWVRETWSDMTPDPRAPLTSA